MKLAIFDYFGTLAYLPTKTAIIFFLKLPLNGFYLAPWRIKDFKGQLKVFLSSSESWEDMAKKVAGYFKKEPTEERIESLAEFLEKNIKFELYGGSKECLDSLMTEGYKIAILTDGGSFLLTGCDLTGVRIFTPQITGFKKPDKRAFSFVLNEYGAIPTDAIMIGDELKDVSAAELGIRSFLLDPKNKFSGKIDGVQKVGAIEEVEKHL